MRDAIAAAAAALSTSGGEVSILLTDDSAVQRAQPRMARHRQADQCSVVSGAENADDGWRRGKLPTLGDIVIAYETLQRECDDEDREFLHHLTHLTVHGFLHLIGYDHQTDAKPTRWKRSRARS